MRDTHRRQRHRQREKQAPCGEPDVGLDPGTPGSCPETKADAQPLSQSGALKEHALSEEGAACSEQQITREEELQVSTFSPSAIERCVQT